MSTLGFSSISTMISTVFVFSEGGRVIFMGSMGTSSSLTLLLIVAKVSFSVLKAYISYLITCRIRSSELIISLF
jgi:hypothetical protein